MLRLLNKGVRIVASISQQMLSIQPFDQLPSLCTIRCGTLRDNDSERHTMRIHGQMQLRVEPPFVTAMASLPPRAPTAWG